MASRSPISSAASRCCSRGYGPILFALAIAGSLAGKRVSPPGLGTMRTDNPTFVVLLIGVIVLVGALTFFPALLLGPIVQGLTGHLYSMTDDQTHSPGSRLDARADADARARCTRC